MTKMKKYILPFFAIAALTVSCQDAYEIDQPGYQTEESTVFNDNASIQRGINALYNGLPIQTEISFGSIFTDEVGLGVNNGGAGINDGSFNFVLESGNGEAGALWANYYSIINRANRMISAIDNMIANNHADTDKLKESKAELLALRAFSNLKLFAYFTPDYTDESGLSILKLDFLQTDDYSVLLPRASVSEIVSFIEDDVRVARELKYGGEEYSTANNEFVSKAFVDAILVKLYSMTENYDGVVENAMNIISGNSHFLYDGTNYLAMFQDNGLANNPEIIMRQERVVSQGGGVASIWYTNRPNRQGSIQFEVGRSLYNEVDKLDPENANQDQTVIRNDIRYQVILHEQSEVATNYSTLSYDDYISSDLLLVGKYLGRDQAIMQNDMMVIRFADVLLALAEARAHQGLINGERNGSFNSVEDIIYSLRKARINNYNALDIITEPASMPVLNTAESAWKAILNERRIEFAFEGHRYLDVKRLGRKANQGFERDPQDCVRNSACYLEPTSYKLTLPIPRAEIIANRNVVQNPGY